MAVTLERDEAADKQHRKWPHTDRPDVKCPIGRLDTLTHASLNVSKTGRAQSGFFTCRGA